MPIYSYTNKAGETIEESFTMAHQPRFIRRGGVRYLKNAAADHHRCSRGKWKPYPSNSLACRPSEIPAMQKFCADAGVQTDFNSRGQPIMASRNHRKRVTKVLMGKGAFDADGGYGDAQPL